MSHIAHLQVAHANKQISFGTLTNVTTWLTEEKYKEFRPEVEKLIAAEDWKTLEDNFFTVVPFGTGGRRGRVGIGSNRINRVTIGESAQGLCNYVLANIPDAKQRGIAVAYDTRLTSVEFSRYVAGVIAANGIPVFLFEGPRPTPELSFTVRHLRTAAGVVVSASHNPPTDNGFKVYWNDGGQIVPPHDLGIMEAVANVKEILYEDFDQALANQRIQYLGKTIDDAYYQAVLGESLVTTRSARIAYSPLHGTGVQSIYPVLERAGFSVDLVAEQASPDGHFPNVPDNIPNPEVQSASNLVTSRAKQIDADIAITTDPDADRLGVVARDAQGEYHFLNGNQIAFTLGAFVLEQYQAQQKLKPEHFLVKTIVTTDGLLALAQKYKVRIEDNILIGFKYVAELIRLHEDDAIFLFGGEESHGILKGSYTRDKDAAVAALLFAELASTCKDAGTTVVAYLDELYKKYGVFAEKLQNIMYEGAAGNEKMASIMQALRTNPPKTLGALRVLQSTDRLSGAIVDPATGKNLGTNPGTKGDVLIYYLREDNRVRVTVRPSGTEPKLKIYVQVHEAVGKDLAQAKASAEQLAQTLLTETAKLCQ